MRNMYSPAKNLPASIGKIEFKPGTEEIETKGVKNLKFALKIGSQSYGNVTVAKGKIFIGTNNENPRDPRHQGDRSILMCFDEKTGEFLWQLVVPKLASGKGQRLGRSRPAFFATVDGDRVYLVTSRCEVLCLDINGMANGNDGPFKDEAKYFVKDVLADRGKPTEHPAPPIEPGPKDADIIWRYDMMDELGVFPHNASNCSVLIVDGIVYVCTSNGQDWTHSNIPSPEFAELHRPRRQDRRIPRRRRCPHQPAHFPRPMEFAFARGCEWQARKFSSAAAMAGATLSIPSR